MARRCCFRTLLFVISTVAVGGAAEKEGLASRITPLELATLPARAEAVVLAKVVKIDKPADSPGKPAPFDDVTIKVASVLKGDLKQNQLRIALQPRGVIRFRPRTQSRRHGRLLPAAGEGIASEARILGQRGRLSEA
ncbi:MAG: hypothetical protein ACYTBJ_07750 [Planctomycetota bacterium]|jgi:hypothetical protein